MHTRLRAAFFAVLAMIAVTIAPPASAQPLQMVAGTAVVSQILTDQAIDYSGARPAPITIINHGYIGVIRYLGAYGDWRAMSSAELAGYRANDIKVAVVYEQGNGNFAVGGCSAGLQVGRAARQYADALGWSGPVYLATDVDIPPQIINTAIDAYRCARDGLGGLEMGAYGGKLLLRGVRDALGVRLLWSSNATSWDHGVYIPVTIQQRYNPNPPIPNTDVDDVYGYWGYWPGGDPSQAVQLPQPEQIKALLESWGFPCVDYEHAGTFWCTAAFQQAFGVQPVDGLFGPVTQATAMAWLTYLLTIQNPPPPVTPPSEQPPAIDPNAAALAFLATCLQGTFSPGDSGPCVKVLQSVLVHDGYSVAQDGEYSYETTGAVTVFQRDNGLPTNGVTTPAVWASLTK